MNKNEKLLRFDYDTIYNQHLQKVKQIQAEHAEEIRDLQTKLHINNADTIALEAKLKMAEEALEYYSDQVENAPAIHGGLKARQALTAIRGEVVG